MEQIARLVGDFDHLSAVGSLSRGLDLKPFSLGLFERLVVGDFGYDFRHAGPELARKLVERRLGILDCVVEQSSEHKI